MRLRAGNPVESTNLSFLPEEKKCAKQSFATHANAKRLLGVNERKEGERKKTELSLEIME
ncbi:hypothetical protein COU38_02590 [Candidatus Micrarchaeota archaeon CG10_big_fil_rev_8_21_14_0_10_54_18]|nr:MAG: hypothetical protein AUJ15_02795 [Candidatus Micrarchaeota archaeon CG1_02_55_41]PIO03207.1 MAG: hypothetical protein COT57_00955 [Candidatus Micrarchaeota archaeon CG09_land_8_20_14_0_10_55_25]PJD01128.1 MAG: hypothetical protein COU38_02590 [Candidatus Micrarchaeota archaeon CG10_big_fil_rev_8_21_14_0_10_54_18]